MLNLVGYINDDKLVVPGGRRDIRGSAVPGIKSVKEEALYV